MISVIFVCTGNTCRSPMMEFITKRLVKAAGHDYEVSSRGINVLIPSRASEYAIQALMNLYNIDLKEHISRQITEKDIQKTEFILTMTEAHRVYLNSVYPGYEAKIFSLGRYIYGKDKDVEDPFGSDLFHYTKCAEELQKTSQDLLEKLARLNGERS